MKEILDRVCSKQIIFKSLQMIEPKLLKTRKKITILSGVDQKSFYHLVFKINQKSRFILKNAQEIVELESILVREENHSYKFKHIIITSAMCSKATTFLKEQGWKIYHYFV